MTPDNNLRHYVTCKSILGEANAERFGQIPEPDNVHQENERSPTK